MAFSVGGGGNATLGPQLELIQTEGLGFTALGRDAKIRLTSPWTSEPAPTACLLSIASGKGMVAAAGPDSLVIASTKEVREKFESPKDGDSDIRSFQPQLKIPLSMRVSQVAFTADEKYLIISAESGGGLAVYSVDQLIAGTTQPALEIATNGEALRALIPNPTPEKAGLCAVLTSNGNLYMADLQTRSLGAPLKSQVSSISWSNRGKQLVAGMADGTIHQMTPEGETKAEIPKPPEVGDYHVSSLVWLENNVFLAIHTSTNQSPPASAYHIITRNPPNPPSFEFRKLLDPVDPFGSDKMPHHMIARLKDFPPNLQDLLIVTSTASADVGLFSRSKTPLAQDKEASSITNVFTMTEMADDSRRATLPMTSDFKDSIPIGCGLDLSSTETVYKPIPTEEIDESPGPVPGYWVLTNEGVLCAWWVIYSESIKSGTKYPGMVAPSTSTSSVSPPAATSPPPALAAPPLSGNSPFASSTAPGGGSAFGSASATPAFGGASALGTKTSPWGAPASSTAASAGTGGPAFGSGTFGSTAPTATPTFGQSSAFGQASNLGAKSSPWASGASGGTAAVAPAFGQTSGFAALGGFGPSAVKSVFGSNSSSTASPAAPSAGGFASFASKSGFGDLGGTPSGGSVFGQPSSRSPFGSGGALATSSSSDTAFPPPQQSTGLSGLGSGGFKLQSSFKADPNAKDDENPSSSGGGGLFGSGFGNAFGSALSDSSKQVASSAASTKDEDMGPSPAAPTPPPQPRTGIFSMPSTTPTTTPAPTRLFSMDSSVPTSSIFSTTPAAPSTSSVFGGFSSRTPETEKNDTRPSPFGALSTTPPSFKQESVETPKIQVANEGESPLPPESTSKAAYPLGESSSSSSTAPGSLRKTPVAEDAPLPPDFLRIPRASSQVAAPLKTTVPVPEDAPLPPDPMKMLAKPADLKPVDPFAIPDNPSSAPNPFAKAIEEQAALADGDSDEFSDGDESEGAYEDEEDEEGDEEDEDVEEGEEEDEDEEDEGSDDSAVDVAKDLSPSTTGLTRTPGLTPQSSFGGGLGGSGYMVGRPNQEQQQPRTLFGEIGGRKAPVLPAPSSGLSPRSPSPVRPPRIQGLDASRSVSAPGIASQILGAKKSQSRLGVSIVGKPRTEEDPILAQQRRAREKRELEETQPLVDEEDDEIQRILAAEVQPKIDIDQFIAHTDVAPPAQDNIPSQVEAIYRDVNSMIDTCGLNARSAMAFVMGNMKKLRPDRRTKDDLDDPEGWVLCEVDELSDIVFEELSPALERARVQDVEAKKDTISELVKNLSRVRAKQQDMEIILKRFDPERTEEQRNLPLSADQAAQQNELRRSVAKFTQQLTELEESLTMLKTKLALANGASGKGGVTQPPTVEAVLRTINKMTSMVEKRSGDVDVLENQLRKLRMSTASREGTPVMTPKKSMTSNFTSDTPTPGGGSRFRSPFSNSVASYKGTPTRKKMSGFSEEEKKELMSKRKRRMEVVGKLKEKVVEKGVQVWAMDEAE